MPPHTALRAQLAAELGASKVFPSARGTWQALAELFFFVPAPADPACPRSLEMQRWSDALCVSTSAAKTERFSTVATERLWRSLVLAEEAGEGGASSL